MQTAEVVHDAHCRRCHARGTTVRHRIGSPATEALLWIAFILPGFIYHTWRHRHCYYRCHECGHRSRMPLRRHPAATS